MKYVCLAAACVLFFSCASAPPGDTEQPQRPSAPSDIEIIADTSYKMYQFFISSQDGAVCIFYPTCSQYMIESLRLHGPAGIFAGLDRIMRCNPAQHQSQLYGRTKEGRLIDLPQGNKHEKE
jgi:putative membrane protein insertion efficiency factor